LSDYIGRKNTYYTFFLLGIAMYLADVFGTQFVGAIHGRLLTAWSTAGIVGPVVVITSASSRSRRAFRVTTSTM